VGLPVHIGLWDAALVVAVSAQCTVISYLREPKWKAVAMSLPIPFTFGSMALGKPVGVTHVTGLLTFLLFMHAVRVLHSRGHLKIVPAIAACCGTYCVVGAILARTLPGSEAAFWTVIGVVSVVSVTLYLTVPPRKERAYRTPLPLSKKLPILVGLIGAIVLMKDLLRGFMPMFPMVGTITAYEARHGLWTVCRQIPALLIAFVPMMIVIHLTQHAVGLGKSLAAGWVVFLAILWPSTWRMWSAERKQW